MDCELEVIKNIFKKSINEFYDKDVVLFEDNCGGSSERSMVFRIGHYMQNEISKRDDCQEFVVDCEYNRHGNVVKRINAKSIIPDLILHKRKTDENNILFVEFKKESNQSYGWASDAKKIKDVTDNEKEYSYKYGFHVILNENEAKVSVYENGIEKCCFTCGSIK